MVTYKLYGEEPGETHRLLDTHESGVSLIPGLIMLWADSADDKLMRFFLFF